jgi:DNA-binding transcriptional ArsR family regulator
MKQPLAILSDFFSALAHESRLRIVEELRNGELCQCELPERLGIEQSNLSRHIKILSSSGVLRTRRDGTRMMLSVSDPVLFGLIDEIKLLLHTRLNLQLTRLESDFDAPLRIADDSRL